MKELTDIVRLVKTPRRSAKRMPPKRLMTYYRHRVGRLPGTSYQVAGGFANGMAVSLTPFIGLHIVLGFVICLITRTSPVAMLIGSVIGGNPWTFPFIWVGSYELGQWLLMRHDGTAGRLRDMTLSDVFHHPVEVLWPMTLGSLPMAALMWMASYGILYYVLHRRARARRLRRHSGGGVS